MLREGERSGLVRANFINSVNMRGKEQVPCDLVVPMVSEMSM